jgi:phage baseplate assembly protein W
VPRGFSPKLPVHRNSSDGYALTKTYEEMVKQNFKHLLLTCPGERMMDPEFGVGLRKYLFSQKTVGLQGEINQRIQSQVNIYMPFIEVTNLQYLAGLKSEPLSESRAKISRGDINFDFDVDENTLSVLITFKIKPLSINSTIDINVL